MKRREFIQLIGGAVAAWPLAARAQQPSIPVVGWLGATTAEDAAFQVEAFRRGLSETGFVDGRSVKIEYRWAEGRYAQLPALAADLVSRKVDAIVASGGSVAALAAQKATATIPIVFASVGADPIKVGLVPNLHRPGGNATGNTIFSNELNSKKLEILHGLVPTTAAIALLVNPDGPTANSAVQDTQEAAHALGRRLLVLRASNEREIDTAWAGVVEQSAGGLIVAPDGFFSARRDQLAALAARHRIPAIYESRAYVRAGGFISYGADTLEAHRLAGIYVGRILKGAKPADLPVLQPTKFDLVINLKAAKDLGITIPNALLIQATELIE
jgi:putative ABC transport system substrate-binding protein